MSMQSWSEYGYGFPVYTGDNTPVIWDFIRSHKDTIPSYAATIQRIEQEAEGLDEEELTDLLDESFDWRVGEVIAQIMQAQTGLKLFEGFPACSDCDTDDVVMYVPAYPWNIPEKDKNVTQQQIHEICEWYCKKLEIPTTSIDFQNLEYFG